MRNRRLLLKVFILTSLFWVAVDILYVLTAINMQMNFFDNSLIPFDGTRYDLRSGERLIQRSDVKPAPPYFSDVIEGLGENGEPAFLPARYQAEAERVFDNHSFNVILSDHISLHRQLKDVRGPK